MNIQNIIPFLVVVTLSLCSTRALAFKEGAVLLGAGYFAQNSINRVSKSNSGETSLLGEASFPILASYQFRFGMDWFVAPQLGYTPLARSAPGNTAKISMTAFNILLGQNFNGGISNWDWHFGPGYIAYEIVGADGRVTMNNGTSTAQFAVPGRTSSIQKITANVGFTYSLERSNLGFDLIIENLLSSQKRVESLMLSYTYQLSGGAF